MNFTATRRINASAFAIAALACAALHGTMLMGFDHLASSSQTEGVTSSQFAKSQIAPRTVKLETVVISSRRA